MSQYVKKITVRTIGVTVEQTETAIEEENVPILIMRVYGQLSGSTPKTSDIGPYSIFTGKFEAVNGLTGEKYRASSLILPEVGEMILEGQLKELEQSDELSEIQFALDVVAEPNPSTKGGRNFKWAVKPLIDSSETDPIAALGEAIQKKSPIQIEQKN